MRVAIKILLAALLVLISGALLAADHTFVDETGIYIPVQANRTNTFSADQTITDDGTTDSDSYKLILEGDNGDTSVFGGMYIDYNDAETRIGSPHTGTGAFQTTIHLTPEYLGLAVPDGAATTGSVAIEFQASNSSVIQSASVSAINHVTDPYFQIQGPLAAGGSADVIHFYGDGQVTECQGDLRVEGGDIGISTDTDLLQLASGAATLNGTWTLGDTAWDDLRLPLTSVTKGPANNPHFDVFLGAVRLYAFDPDTEQELFFTAQLSHAYKYGTDLHPHVHWSPKTTDTGNAKWCIEYTLAEIDGTYGAPTTICGIDAGDGTAYKHQYVDLGDIDGSAIDTLSATIAGRIYRDADDGVNDTFTGDAYGVELDFHYEVDTMGSASELTK